MALLATSTNMPEVWLAMRELLRDAAAAEERGRRPRPVLAGWMVGEGRGVGGGGGGGSRSWSDSDAWEETGEEKGEGGGGRGVLSSEECHGSMRRGTDGSGAVEGSAVGDGGENGWEGKEA